MRFSTSSALLALPLLAAAQAQDPLAQALDTAQQFFNKITSFIPHTNTFDAAEATLAKESGKNIEILSLDNWRSTLLNSVTPASTGPEEWWVLLTGGNKTCWGNCDRLTGAFNESAQLFKSDPTAPHLAMINCDHQPVLCHSWVAGPPMLYIFDVSPAPAPVPLHVSAFNTTTVTAEDFIKLHQTNIFRERPEHTGFFHPFNGDAHKYGLDIVVGWTIWAFNVLPNWLFMILISFASRTMMSRRGLTNPPAAPAGAGRPAAAKK